MPSLSAWGFGLEADPEELESEDFGADPEVEELGLELGPLDLGLLEYEPEDLFSRFSWDISGPLSPIASVKFLG